MFEKDIEELFKKKPLGYEMKPELEIYKDGFKDGYDKALKDEEQMKNFKEVVDLTKENERLKQIILKNEKEIFEISNLLKQTNLVVSKYENTEREIK